MLNLFEVNRIYHNIILYKQRGAIAMPASKKAFKFQYCFINVVDSNKKIPEKFNFAAFFEKFIGLPKSSRTISLHDYKAKIERFSQAEDRFVHICFVKMIDKAMPKKALEDERDSLNIEFKDDEYLGFDAHMLYDMNNKVAMIQRTRESLSIQNISIYLNEFAHKLSILNKNQIIEIQPITDTNTLSSKSKIKKLNIRFGNIENIRTDDTNNILQILKAFNKFSAKYGEITLSVGRSKNTLDNSEVTDTIQIVKELKEKYDNCISGAKIAYVENDISFCYDLFDDVMNDVGYIEIVPREPINYDNVEYEMLQLYRNKLPHLNSVIGYK